MEKTLILGNNREAYWIKNFPEDIVRSVSKISVNREEELSAFLEGTLPRELEILLIDLDSIEDTETALQLALRLRLMLYTFKKTSLCHIVLVSDLGIESYIDHGIASVLLMTKNVSFEKGGKLLTLMDSFKPLTPAEYVTGFLNLIKIVPQSNFEGRHSIANEWGADILAKVISFGQKSEFIPLKTSASLYFIYCTVCSLNVKDIEKIITNAHRPFHFNDIKINAKFNYLLLDDEADKGWDKVLELLMPFASQKKYVEKLADYTCLPEELKMDIESLKYDIIFLDLRMNGVQEESIYNPDEFSGMKILKSIKKINKGIQVIMLTATNKGWNVKALLDAGANGYYMKESPEYHFKLSYSIQNAESLQKTILTCLSDSYLKSINKKCEMGLSKLSENSEVADLYRVIKINWESGIILLEQHHYKDALLQLILALEAYSNKYTALTDDGAVVYFKTIDFKSPIDEEEMSWIFDEKGAYYKMHKGIFQGFQKSKTKHTINVTVVEDGSNMDEVSLTLPLKIAAVLDQHLGSLKDMPLICELIYIRNNRLAHHGINNDYNEKSRPVTKEDCQFIFDLTFKLIMAD